jgi:DNA-binding NarL/FixJ family response regulator
MRVMIAEDDTLHRAFARNMIEHLWPDEIEVIEASSGDRAIDLANLQDPLYVVLDLQLPTATGIEVARAIWSRRADTRILFWSNFADEAYVRGVARIVPPGAVYGYVLKSASEEGMRVALRGVFQEGHCIIDREIRGIQHRTQDRREGITDCEYESLIDIALGLTDKTVADRRGLSTRGAQNRIQRLYEKLGFATIAEAATNSTNLFNSRTRAVYLALARGLINVDALRREQQNFEVWATHAAGARKRKRRTQLSKALALAPTVETRSR